MPRRIVAVQRPFCVLFPFSYPPFPFHYNECFRVRLIGKGGKACKSIYPSNTYSITGVELVAENVTATKEQERRALDKIKAIIAELGPQSYLGTAFDGVFEIAESNIEYDFGESAREKWESAKKETETMRERVEAMELRQANELRKVSQACQVSEKQVNEIKDLESQIEQLQSAYLSLNHILAEEKDNSNELKKRLEALQYENVALKAKLYDLIVAA